MACEILGTDPVQRATRLFATSGTLTRFACLIQFERSWRDWRNRVKCRLMQILVLQNAPAHVSFRYRLDAFRPYLEAHGHTVRYECRPTWWMPWSGLWQRLRSADIIILQRRLLPIWKLNVLRRAAKTLVFDFDDAVFCRDSFDPRGPSCEKRHERFVHMIRTVDAVVAGNAYLREQASLWTNPDKIILAPTCIAPEHYPQARHRHAGAGVRLAWIGSSSTLRGLEKIREILEEVGKHQAGLNLKVICDRSLVLKNLPVQFCRWSQETEARDLADADIGISWLPADTWSRGKCGLKVLQYMAAGLPVVANPVGIHTNLVRHGETGLLAQTPEQWLDAIRRLALDPTLRRRLGAAGRRRIVREFHVQQGAAAWLDLFKTFRHVSVAASPCR